MLQLFLHVDASSRAKAASPNDNSDFRKYSFMKWVITQAAISEEQVFDSGAYILCGFNISFRTNILRGFGKIMIDVGLIYSNFARICNN